MERVPAVLWCGKVVGRGKRSEEIACQTVRRDHDTRETHRQDRIEFRLCETTPIAKAAPDTVYQEHHNEKRDDGHRKVMAHVQARGAEDILSVDDPEVENQDKRQPDPDRSPGYAQKTSPTTLSLGGIPFDVGRSLDVRRNP